MPIRGTSQPSTRQWLVNPHLDGSPFLIGTGPVGILLCHGFTATTAEVKPLSSHLCAADFTVPAPLLPGHYTRPQDLNRVSWKDWVATVEDSYHDLFLRCKGVFVGGESTGGILALYLASKHPEIAGILAYAPALRLNLSLIEILMVYFGAPFIPYLPKINANHNKAWQGYPVNPLKGTVQLLNFQRIVRASMPDDARVAVEAALTRGLGRQVALEWPETGPPRLAAREEVPEHAIGAVDNLLMQAGIRLENLALVEQRAAAERRAVELREASMRAELRALHAQVQPHFLFNALNALSYLTETDPRAAQRFTERLADMLR